MRADRGASGVCYCYTMLPQLSGGTFVQMLVQPMEMQTGVCDIFQSLLCTCPRRNLSRVRYVYM